MERESKIDATTSSDTRARVAENVHYYDLINAFDLLNRGRRHL